MSNILRVLTYTCVFMTLSSGCKTAASSTVKGLPSEDSDVSAARHRFVSTQLAQENRLDVLKTIPAGTTLACTTYYATKNASGQNRDAKIIYNPYFQNGVLGFGNSGNHRVKSWKWDAIKSAYVGHYNGFNDPYECYARVFVNADSRRGFTIECTVTKRELNAEIQQETFPSEVDYSRYAIAYEFCSTK